MASVVEPCFSPTSPHFFTIILQHTLQNNKLQIPKKTLRKCGSALSDEVYLKLPCGSKWKLGLTKSSEGKVWIDKGWPEFSKHYSIERGHLLVFRYEGNSQFHVVIFDTTTTEIDYPFEKHIDSEKQNQNKFVNEETNSDGDEDDNSVEILDSSFSRPCPKAREKSPLPCPRPHKRSRNDPVNGKLASSAKDGGDGGENSVTPLRLSAKEKAQALNRASGFESNNPFFMVAMQPSYVQAKYLFNVPRHFAKLYLNACKQVTLKAPDGRTWSVKYKLNGFDRNGSKPRFECGWKAFARDNDLKRGDVCVFVMTKSVGSSVFFEVSFYRENSIANSASVPVSKAEGSKLGQTTSIPTKVKSDNTKCTKVLAINRKCKALEIASSFESQNPFFTVVMHASYTNSRSHFNIPAKFAKTYLKKNQCDISLCVSDGRSWSVKYRIRSKTDGLRSFELCHGWFVFARESGLQEGDICTFELTNRDKVSFNVHIVKVSHKAYKQMPLAIKSEKTRLVGPERNASARTRSHLLMKPMAKEELEKTIVETAGKSGAVKIEKNNAAGQVGPISKASEAASKFSSENPYFQVDFPSSHLDKTSLNLPTDFGSSYLEEKTQTVTLKVGEQSWPVKLLFYYPRRYKFSRGWSEFATENSLRPSDICIFELIERNQAVLKVTIFRKSG